MNPSAQSGPRTLVAGIGNIFLGDDGFGVETAAPARRARPARHVEVVDIGVRGVHLAYQLLDGYDTLVLVDATARGEAPGTLYVIEHDGPAARARRRAPRARRPPDDPRHRPGAAGHPLRRHRRGATTPASWSSDANRPRVEEGIGLSAPVSDAVPEAVRLIEELLRQRRTVRRVAGHDR